MNAEIIEAGDGPLHAWQAALEAGRFTLQCCDACNRHVFYPRVICPHCAGNSLQWVKPSGLGTVHSVTIVARRVEKGGPYNVVLVDLDEGVRLMSRVDGADLDEIKIGMRVQHDIARDSDKAILVFRPLAHQST